MILQIMKKIFTFKVCVLYLYFGITLPAVAAGRGVPRDPNKAFLWFLAAANKGDASAQNNLGGNYYNGYGVQQNTTKAIEWFQKSANQGYAPAKANLIALRVNDSNVEIFSTKVATNSQNVVLKKYNIPSLGQISIPRTWNYKQENIKNSIMNIGKHLVIKQD